MNDNSKRHDGTFSRGDFDMIDRRRPSPPGRKAAWDKPQFGHRVKVAVHSMLALGLVTEETMTRLLRQGLGAIMDIAEFPLQV